jgi:hypothetical protein
MHLEVYKQDLISLDTSLRVFRSACLLLLKHLDTFLLFSFRLKCTCLAAASEYLSSSKDLNIVENNI